MNSILLLNEVVNQPAQSKFFLKIVLCRPCDDDSTPLRKRHFIRIGRALRELQNSHQNINESVLSRKIFERMGDG